MEQTQRNLALEYQNEIKNIIIGASIFKGTSKIKTIVDLCHPIFDVLETMQVRNDVFDLEMFEVVDNNKEKISKTPISLFHLSKLLNLLSQATAKDVNMSITAFIAFQKDIRVLIENYNESVKLVKEKYEAMAKRDAKLQHAKENPKGSMKIKK